MVNVLESRLEAQALHYITFGVFTAVNNLWTWIAVITAAVSYWRIRSTGRREATPCLKHNTTEEASPPRQIQSESVSLPESAAVPSFCDGGDTKGGKITFYYEQEEEIGVEEEERESDGEITAVSDGCEEWFERVMRVRVVDMSWRRYQDLTVINGNVVRLWDEERYSLFGVSG